LQFVAGDELKQLRGVIWLLYVEGRAAFLVPLFGALLWLFALAAASLWCRCSNKVVFFFNSVLRLASSLTQRVWPWFL
jgi:hypothetical protein